MPGTDPAEAMRVVAGELPDFPHLPELPDRGPGADLTGRTAALLIEIPVEVTPRGWRLAERRGHRGDYADPVDDDPYGPGEPPQGSGWDDTTSDGHPRWPGESDTDFRGR